MTDVDRINLGDTITWGHYHNSGDLIAWLPGFKHLYERRGTKVHIYQRINLRVTHDVYNPDSAHPVHLPDGTASSMTVEMMDLLKPLILAQPYVYAMDEWEGEDVQINSLNLWHRRSIPVQQVDLSHGAFLACPGLECDLSIPWLEVPPSENKFNDLIISDHVIINRTQRYYNPWLQFFWLKDFQEKLIFAGVKEERDKFCEEWKLDTIPLLEVSNFMQLAQAINECRFFMGNQSMCWHIAEALKKTRMLEACFNFPNTYPHGKGGMLFYEQEHMELKFKELFFYGE